MILAPDGCAARSLAVQSAQGTIERACCGRPPSAETQKIRRRMTDLFWSSTCAINNTNGAAMLHSLPRLRLGLGRADYSLAVKRNANGSWRWEVNCGGRSTPVERSSIHLDTMTGATKAGKETLKLFLNRFFVEPMNRADQWAIPADDARQHAHKRRRLTSALGVNRTRLDVRIGANDPFWTLRRYPSARDCLFLGHGRPDGHQECSSVT